MLDPDYVLWRDLLPQLDCEGMIDQFIPKSFAEFLVSGFATTAFQEDKTQCAVRINVAGMEKSLSVSGDRYWVDNNIVGPEPFERMEISWENAFGGSSFSENPNGKGADKISTPIGRAFPLPNVEALTQRVGRPGQRVEAASFGAIPFTRPSRLKKGGSYSDAWLKNEFPGFFSDIDLTMFNSASPDQRWEDTDAIPLGAAFHIWNMNESEHCWSDKLPLWYARCFVLREENNQELFREVSLKPTTAWFVPHEKKIILIYHGSIEIQEDDAADIKCIMPALESPNTIRSVDWYEEVLHRRKDPENGAIYAFRDFELVPKNVMNPLNLDEIEVTNLERWKKAQEKKEQLTLETKELLISAGQDPADYLPEMIGPQRQYSPEDIPDLLEKNLEVEIQAEAQKQEVKKKILDTMSFGDPKDMEEIVDNIFEGKVERPTGPPKPIKQKINEMLNPNVAQLIADNSREADFLKDQIPFSEIDQRSAMETKEFAEKLEKIEDKFSELKKTYLNGERFKQVEKMEPLNRKMYLYSVQIQGDAPRVSDHKNNLIRALIQERMNVGNDLSMMDLTGADLSCMNLSNMNLTGSFLESAILTQADLSGCDLTETVLARTDLRHCNLSNAKLVRANLSLANTELGNFSGAEINECIVEGTTFNSCNFTQANIHNMIPTGIVFDACDFSEAELSFINFANCKFNANRFDKATLKKVTFFNTLFIQDRFPGAILDSSHFVQSRLQEVSFDLSNMMNVAFTYHTESERCTFIRAHLKQCNLRGMNLENHCFAEANIEMSDFSEADMSGVQAPGIIARDALFVRTSFLRSDLSDGNLMQANLKSANLERANFSKVNFFRAELGKSYADETTRLAGTYTKQANIYPTRNKE